jgi:acyl-CoA reductase-like NAD-dependent aldehyde dehydrogenase
MKRKGLAVTLLDQFSSIFGMININSQCRWSPNTLPFSGWQLSAMGVMSIKHALLTKTRVRFSTNWHPTL